MLPDGNMLPNQVKDLRLWCQNRPEYPLADLHHRPHRRHPHRWIIASPLSDVSGYAAAAVVLHRTTIHGQPTDGLDGAIRQHQAFMKRETHRVARPGPSPSSFLTHIQYYRH